MDKKIKQNKKVIYYPVLVALLLAAMSNTALGVSSYTISRSVIDSGGGESASANYSIQASLGQASAGLSTSAGYALYSGFLAVSDTDGDGILDNVVMLLIPHNSILTLMDWVMPVIWMMTTMA